MLSSVSVPKSELVNISSCLRIYSHLTSSWRGDKVTAEKCVNTISRHFSQLDRFNILKPQYPDGACWLIRTIMGGQSGWPGANPWNLNVKVWIFWSVLINERRWAIRPGLAGTNIIHHISEHRVLTQTQSQHRQQGNWLIQVSKKCVCELEDQTFNWINRFQLRLFLDDFGLVLNMWWFGTCVLIVIVEIGAM